MPADLSAWVAARRPLAAPLEGRYCRLEKLDAARHGDDLWAAFENHDSLWDYLGYGPFADRAAFGAWLESRVPLADPLSYAVIDRQAERALGIITLMEIRPESGVIEVGHIVFSPLLQRTPTATEAIALAGRHVFRDLGYRRFEWKCNAANEPSRRAAARFGFVAEGVFRQHMIVKARNRDTAWFSIVDHEWPLVERAFDRWLAPENFGPRGEQKVALSQMTTRHLEVGALKLDRMDATAAREIETFQQSAYAKNREVLGVEPMPLKWNYDEIFVGTEVWGVRDRDRLVGVLILRPRQDDLYLESVATLPEVQGGGYGNAMLSATEFRAVDWGYRTIRLMTGELLVRNVEWYRRKGFNIEELERTADRNIVHMIRHIRN